MQLFFDETLHKDLQYHTVSGEEAWHCIKVLRLNIKDKIFLTDGRGLLYNAFILSIDLKKKLLEIEISDIKEIERLVKAKLHIAIAPTKNIDRFEYFLEKATEIGISEITPIITRQSERKLINLERLNKIVVSALKQSAQFYIPLLNDITPLDKFMQEIREHNRYIAHCEYMDKKLLNNYLKPNEDCLILIGPEGDFTREEISEAKLNNFKEISLGYNRLRTETAGIVACHSFNLINTTF